MILCRVRQALTILVLLNGDVQGGKDWHLTPVASAKCVIHDCECPVVEDSSRTGSDGSKAS